MASLSCQHYDFVGKSERHESEIVNNKLLICALECRKFATCGSIHQPNWRPFFPHFALSLYLLCQFVWYRQPSRQLESMGWCICKLWSPEIVATWNPEIRPEHIPAVIPITVGCLGYQVPCLISCWIREEYQNMVTDSLPLFYLIFWSICFFLFGRRYLIVMLILELSDKISHFFSSFSSGP